MSYFLLDDGAKLYTSTRLVGTLKVRGDKGDH